MIAVRGSGQLSKPYVVYKATHLYPTWVENGAEGTVYNRSKSGCFDGKIFENWFQEVALPHLEKCHGKKILIGQGYTAEHSNTETPSSSVAVDDEILADEVLEEAEAEEQEVETCSNEDSDKENITFVADDHVLVQFKCPYDKTKYYVGRIISVVDDNLLVVNFLRSKDSLKHEKYLFYPDIKDERSKSIRRNRFAFSKLPDV
ncbi:hypothetical protein JTB14_012668 [Gonioctena quinquepunctata]|nr:hypothetical protein JTB14_012668 [Gonioctena quinquepunctata]